MKYIGIDIGGTWIKGTLVDENVFIKGKLNSLSCFKIKKVKSSLHENTTPGELIKTLKELISCFNATGEEIKGIGISTAGIVNYRGTMVLKAAKHLNVLKTNYWKTELENQLQCNAIVINDADAATIGIAELGFLKGNKSVGIMSIGTGLGFSVWRNGRRWRPGKMLNLLGSIRTPSGFYDEIASASKLASEDSNNNLIKVLTKDEHNKAREEYLVKLVIIINTAAIIYNLDEVKICGGLADAVTACGFPLESKLNSLLSEQQVELDKTVRASVMKEGNKLQLIGALLLAKAESIANEKKLLPVYASIPTEVPYEKNIQLQDLSTSKIIKLLWKAEQEGGDWLEKSIPHIEHSINIISERINKGGRLIYVGSGTSGRIAAMDTVEIPCTYGFPEDRIITLIAGGIADAAIEIESDFEEDASSVSEMLLLDISELDTVIGISASGNAYYVQSALAFAKERGAFAVLIQSHEAQEDLPFCDFVIPLNSGYEVVAGSTRMKAGTATKKIVNFITSTLMIKMGKVAGSYMVDVACINNKLVERAQNILKTIYNINETKAMEMLKKENMNLGKVIHSIQQNQNKEYE
ncbi:N-acetylmuramic acid 6-phosphate etherase [Desulfosarcina sp.]|nr:N-acetylmuramic acid 6-phosphate etherase [Desulfosarcina sp.]